MGVVDSEPKGYDSLGNPLLSAAGSVWRCQQRYARPGRGGLAVCGRSLFYGEHGTCAGYEPNSRLLTCFQCASRNPRLWDVREDMLAKWPKIADWEPVDPVLDAEAEARLLAKQRMFKHALSGPGNPVYGEKSGLMRQT